MLATTGSQRSVAFPSVPTLKELGYPKFTVTNWYGPFVPAKTPNELVARLNTAFCQAMKSPEPWEGRAKLDSRVPNLSAAEFTDFVRKEVRFWKTLVTMTGVKAER